MLYRLPTATPSTLGTRLVCSLPLHGYSDFLSRSLTRPCLGAMSRRSLGEATKSLHPDQIGRIDSSRRVYLRYLVTYCTKYWSGVQGCQLAILSRQVSFGCSLRDGSILGFRLVHFKALKHRTHLLAHPLDRIECPCAPMIQ